MTSSRQVPDSFSRRHFLMGLGAGFAGLLAACSGPDGSSDPRPDPTPTPDLAPDTEPSATSTRPAARSTATSTGTATRASGTPTPGLQGSQATATEEYDDADEEVEPTGTPVDESSTATAVATREPTQIMIDYIPVVSRRLQIRDIPFDRLEAIWNGEIQDWSELGEPGSHPIRRATVEGSSGPFDPALADMNITHLDDLESFLHFNTGTIALLPRQRVNFRFRHLKIDGVDHLVERNGGNPIRMAITVDPRNPQEFDLIKESVGSPEPVSMTWVGDIIFGRFVHKAMERIGDFSAPFWDVREELIWADLTIGNLECSLSDTIPQPLDSHTFSFTTISAAVEGLKLAEIDVLSRANNHTMDFGTQGMNDTAVVLNEAGIKHFGIGSNLDEARKAVVVELNGINYAFLGYNGITHMWDGAGPTWAGTMPMNADYVVQDIQRELAAGHVVIPYFHWGIEYVADPTSEQRFFAHLAIDNGAAMVMGSHPHWVQAVETYRGKAIVYSLGNFIFDQAWSIETQQGMIAHVWMSGSQALSIDLVPVFIEAEHRPRVMGPHEAVPVFNRVWQATDRILASG